MAALPPRPKPWWAEIDDTVDDAWSAVPAFEPLDRVAAEVRGSEVDVTAWRGRSSAWAISLGTGSGDATILDASAALLDGEYTAVRIVTQRRGSPQVASAVVWLDGQGGQLGASRLEPADTVAVGPGGVLALHAAGKAIVVTQFDPGRAVAVKRWHVDVADELWRTQGGLFDDDVRLEPRWDDDGGVRLTVVAWQGMRRLGSAAVPLPAEVPVPGSRVVRFEPGQRRGRRD
jgi:hypothetical protein